MDITTLSLVVALGVSAIINVLQALRKNIRRSSCLGGSVEFREEAKQEKDTTPSDSVITITTV